MTDRNRYGNDNLPDFFQTSNNAPLLSSSLLSSLESSNDIDISDNFDIPLTGLPDFFQTPSSSSTTTNNNVQQSARIVAARAEADDLAAITGDTGDMDAWTERAAEYAAIQANYLKDLQAQKIKEANAYGRDYFSSASLGNNNKDDNSQHLASILHLGLDDDEDDVASPVPSVPVVSKPVIQQRTGAPTTAPTNNSLLSLSSTTGTNAALSAEDLEAQLLNLAAANKPAPVSAPAPAPVVTAPSSGPRLVSLTTMQPVAIPPGWNASLPPPPGTIVIYDQQPSAPSQANVVPPSSVSAPMPPQQYQQQPPIPQQQQFPQAMPPMAMPNTNGPLPPNMVMMLQQQLAQANALVNNTPGGINALPPQMRMQIAWMQQLLQNNQIMMQRMQMAHVQQQQYLQAQQQQQQQAQKQQAPPVPSVPAPTPAVPATTTPAVTSPTKGDNSAHVKPGISYSKILAPDRAASAPALSTASTTEMKVDTKTDDLVSVGPIVKNATSPQQPTRILARPNNPPLPTGAAPPLPPGPPPSKPVTLTSVLSAPLPGKIGGNRMSKPEVIAVSRLMFNQLATADPFSEAYYHFALATKASAARAQEAKRLQALAMGIQINVANEGNVFDAAAVLTSMGTSAIAGGRGKETKTSTDDATANTPNASANQPTRTASETTSNPTADLLAALPTQSLFARNMAANLDDLKKLHAIKRRLWETHNHVLGRQESASIRAPKRTLNLTESGITTGNDLREHKTETNVISSNHNGTDENAAASVPTWTARARIDSAHDSILSLQDAARTLQGYLRLTPPPPSNIIDQGRANVNLHRLSLASALGLKAGAPVPPPINPNDEPEIQEASVKAAQAAMVAAENIHGSQAIDDNVILSILSLPKGKRLFARAGPMLSPNDRITLVIAGMRHLPYFVASTGGGKDAETADSTLSQTLATWIRTWTNTGNNNNLSMLNNWITELQQKHNGSVIRALLQHPGASDVISALLTRGEGEANSYSNSLDTSPENIKESVQTWRLVTDALGRAFVEAA